LLSPLLAHSFFEPSYVLLLRLTCIKYLKLKRVSIMKS
jgi:hypothetical protein